MSYKYLPDVFKAKEAIASLRADMRAICEIMARGEGEVAFEDIYLSIMNTLRDMERDAQ